MTTIITSLPHATNDGKSTFLARVTFFATLRLNGVKFTVETPCTGFWYADDGKLYKQETTLVTMTGSEAAMRGTVGAFGAEVGDLEMLFVPRCEGYILNRGQFSPCAEYFAEKYGGATLLPNADVVSFRYASLVAGVDYSDANLVR
jgi:hypothetical protein